MGCNVNNHTFIDMKTACMAYGIPYASVRYRIVNKNETVEEAINSLRTKDKRYNIFGKNFERLCDIANEYNIDRVRFYGYLNKYGKTREIIENYIKIQNKKEMEGKRIYNIFGKEYSSIYAIEKSFDIARNQLNKKVSHKNLTDYEIEKMIKNLIFNRSILGKIGNVYIVRVNKNGTEIFLSENELEKVLIYKDYDSSFCENRKWEKVG